MSKVKNIEVEGGGRKRSVFLCMTDDEAKDRSFVNEYESANRDKTVEQLNKLPPREKPEHSKKEVAGAIKEYIEYRDRHREGGKKYY